MPASPQIEAQTPAGAFYAVCTLVQIVEQAGQRSSAPWRLWTRPWSR
jgi:hypothetical protein